MTKSHEIVVTIGLDTIGVIRETGKMCQAFDATGDALGVFPAREKAQLEIWRAWRTASNDGGRDE